MLEKRCLFNAYVKYGIENFKFEIVCICFDEACNELEKFYIEKFKTLYPNGYNLRAAGIQDIDRSKPRITVSSEI